MNDDEPVLVIDLRSATLAADRDALGGSPAPDVPDDEPLTEDETIAHVALLHDASDAPLLLPIEPTRDRRWLDALARLIRFAVLRGERVPSVAVRYGTEYERSLAFERRLPRWAYEGIDTRHLPPEIARALGPR